MNKYMSTCPFYSKDKLCSIQCKLGEEYVCNVCRIYPRNIFNFGFAATKFLDLSCPQVASLFCEHLNDMSLIHSIENIDTVLYGTNDDEAYFNFLIECMHRIEEIIFDTDLSLGQIYYSLISLGNKMQKTFLENPNDMNITLNLDSYFSKDHLTNVPDFFIDSQMVDSIITNGYYHKRIKRESPLLYKLCKLYFNAFDKCTIGELNDLNRNYQNLINLNLNESNDLFIRKYLWYTFNQSFLEVFEDYSFIRKMTIPVIKTHLLLMFIHIYDKKIGTVNSQNLPLIISAFNRRGGDISGLYDNIFDLVYTKYKDKEPFS